MKHQNMSNDSVVDNFKNLSSLIHSEYVKLDQSFINMALSCYHNNRLYAILKPTVIHLNEKIEILLKHNNNNKLVKTFNRLVCFKTH